MSGKQAGSALWERMNTHETMTITVECFGQTIRLNQDPNTEHLGTTVWDASIVLAKMLEKNMRKGEFSRTKLAGKRALELGAGMGLGGIALALLGMEATITDTKEVLPLLRRNCETNLGVGKVVVRELDWMQPEQFADLSPPFDLVIAADCIYAEHIVPYFHATVMAMTTAKSTVLVVNELRSQSVHAAFMAAFTPTHVVKRMPASKLDEMYQHPLIEVYVLKRKKEKGEADAGAADTEAADEPAAADSEQDGASGASAANGKAASAGDGTTPASAANGKAASAGDGTTPASAANGKAASAGDGTTASSIGNGVAAASANDAQSAAAGDSGVGAGAAQVAAAGPGGGGADDAGPRGCRGQAAPPMPMASAALPLTLDQANIKDGK